LDEQLDKELRFHIEEQRAGLIADGVEPGEALRQARIAIGGSEQVKESCRDARGTRWLEDLWRDLRYALRTIRQRPGFASVVTLTLALGIGGNTAMFTVIRAVLLKPLAYRDPDRLVHISGGATLTRFEEMRTAARSYTGLGAFAVGLENITFSGGTGPEVLKAARVSANFLRILDVEPMLGRSFASDEDAPGGPNVTMISAELWRNRFGGDPMIAGRTVTLNSTPYTIIGVLPTGFQFPFPGLDLWVTRPSEWSVIPSQGRLLSPILSVFGRLKPHVDVEQASAGLIILNYQYATAHPGTLDSKPNSIERVRPLKDELVANVRSLLWILFGAVGFVLLIACANVASLLLARATSRSREFALRAALGAGRRRLIGQLLAESVLLACAGGALGVLLAKGSLSAIARMSAVDLPRTGEIRMDGMVLGFAVSLSIATGVLFGLVPSLGASRPDLTGALRISGAAASSVGSKRVMLWFSARGALVVGQVALSIVLLIGATLLMKSLADLNRSDLGFKPANVLTMKIALPPARYDADQKKAVFYDELVQRVQSLPGVLSAAVTLTLPMTGFSGTPVQRADGPPLQLNQQPIGIIQSITPAYFRTLGISLRRGREFTEHDSADAVPVTMISEGLAHRLWPEYPSGQDPVGQHIRIGVSPQPVEIVGVVADIHEASASIDPRPGLYRPSAQAPPRTAMFAVRTEGDPLQLVNAVRSQVLAIDPDQPVSAVQTMQDVVETDLGQQRLITILLGSFASVALLLAVVGIYGVIAYSVAQQIQEVGIRRALGAQQSDILRLVVGQGLGLVLVGVALGLAGALALTRVLKSVLFHISATDPATFASIALLFVVVALAASYIPARRAARIDPTTALRIG
jgi:predicted permease